MVRCTLCGFFFTPECDVLTCDICRQRLAEKLADDESAHVAAAPLIRLGPGGDYTRDILQMNERRE